MTYAEQLKDRRWQKKRLELLEAADWKCQIEGCNASERSQLHIHHKVYLRGKKAWEYPGFAYQVLCAGCHLDEQGRMERRAIALASTPDLCVLVDIFSDPTVHDSLGEIMQILNHYAQSDLLLEALRSAMCGFHEGVQFALHAKEKQG
jgi:hypothetical protein